METWFDVIVDLSNAWAWPVIIFALMLIFRGSIIDLISLIESIKFGNVEVRVGNLIERAESQAQTIQTSQDPPSIDERILDIANTYPRGAMIESWLLVERGLIELAGNLNVEMNSRQTRSSRQLARALARAGIIDDNLAAIVSDMQSVRNSVAHISDYSPSQNDALEYASLAARVTQALLDKHSS